MANQCLPILFKATRLVGHFANGYFHTNFLLVCLACINIDYTAIGSFTQAKTAAFKSEDFVG